MSSDSEDDFSFVDLTQASSEQEETASIVGSDDKDDVGSLGEESQATPTQNRSPYSLPQTSPSLAALSVASSATSVMTTVNLVGSSSEDEKESEDESLSFSGGSVSGRGHGTSPDGVFSPGEDHGDLLRPIFSQRRFRGAVAAAVAESASVSDDDAMAVRRRHIGGDTRRQKRERNSAASVIDLANSPVPVPTVGIGSHRVAFSANTPEDESPLLCAPGALDGSERKRRRQERQGGDGDKSRRTRKKRAEKEEARCRKRRDAVRQRAEEGRFALKEVVVHMEQSLAGSVTGKAIAAALHASGVAVRIASHPVEGAVWFTRRGWARDAGGKIQVTDATEDTCASSSSATAAASRVEPTPITGNGSALHGLLLLVWQPHDLLSRLPSHTSVSEAAVARASEDAHPAAALLAVLRTARSFVASRSTLAPSTSRIIMLLENVDKVLLHMQRAQQRLQTMGERRLTPELLSDTLTWLYIAEGYESQRTSSPEATASAVAAFAAMIANLPYREPVTALDVAPKYKSHDAEAPDRTEAAGRGNAKVGGHSTGASAALARQVWMSQLRCIPRVSESKARHIVRSFPTFASLMRAYHDSSIPVESKRRLLESSMSHPGRGAKREPKLSAMIYEVFTSRDPKMVVK